MDPEACKFNKYIAKTMTFIAQCYDFYLKLKFPPKELGTKTCLAHSHSYYSHDIVMMLKLGYM